MRNPCIAQRRSSSAHASVPSATPRRRARSYFFAASRARTSAIQLCASMSWLLSMLVTITNCEPSAETVIR